MAVKRRQQKKQTKKEFAFVREKKREGKKGTWSGSGEGEGNAEEVRWR